MAAITIHSDFRAQEEEICLYFHLFPFYLPWSNGVTTLMAEHEEELKNLLIKMKEESEKVDLKLNI